MWIFTVNGFFTFVTDRKDPSYLWLRARMREHIEDNFPGVTAEAKPGADYLWRAKVKRDDVALRIAELVMESNVDSHFKDVMIRTAAKPKPGQGTLGEVMYAVWSGAAKWQDYAPYSKVPRTSQKTTWKGTAADRRPGTGQQAMPLEPYTYGGAGSGRYASDFDWNSRDWGGTSAPDPKVAETPEATDAELDAWWMSLSDEERDAILDAEEASLRQREEIEEDLGAAARAFDAGVGLAEVTPAPRNRPGTRRNRKKNRRRNRHNQYTQLGFSDSQARQEATNRETYLAKKAAKGGRA